MSETVIESKNMALYRDDEEFIDRKKQRPSAAWDYFEKKDGEKKIALCTLCQTSFSYKSTVSNLMKHLRTIHNIGVSSTSEEQEDEIVEKDELDEGILSTNTQMTRNSKRSSMWMFFKTVDTEAKMAACILCKHLLSYKTSITNLKRHLNRKHPGLRLPDDDNKKRIILSTGDELYEIETTPTKQQDDEDENVMNDPIDVDEVYLEDFNDKSFSEIDGRRTKRKSIFEMKSKKRKSIIACSDSSSSDAEHANVGGDSLEYFGKYIISLLKQLPKKISNRLQADFIRQTMEALSEASSDGVPVIGDSSVAVKKSQCNGTVLNEGNVTDIEDVERTDSL